MVVIMDNDDDDDDSCDGGGVVIKSKKYNTVYETVLCLSVNRAVAKRVNV